MMAPSEIKFEDFVPHFCPCVYYTATYTGRGLVILPVWGNETLLLAEKKRTNEALNKAIRAFKINDKN
jgi:hypothetical protein